jgi:hypothetical protein
MSEFNEQLFVRVCTLEAELELLTKKLYEAEEKVKCLEKLLSENTYALPKSNDRN